MMKLLFFDTETTGNTTNDFLCQLAYKSGTETFSGLYRPPIKIPPEASAVHHITNKMVAEHPSLSESGDLPKLKEVFEDKDAVLVAHNAPFDLLMIKKEGIEPKKSICTLRVARHLDKEEKIERYNLQYLRYLLELEVDAEAHDALGDVLVLEKLYERLEKKMMEELAPTPQENSRVGVTTESVVKKMIEISSHPSLLHTFRFGKYNGKKIEEVLRLDRSYLEWLLGQKLNGDGVDEDWIYTLKHYLGK
jgi:exodeoxyribonuclease X